MLRYTNRATGINLLLIRIKSKNTKKLQGVGCPRGVMVKAMDCGIVVSNFVLQFRSLSGKHPWKMYESPYPPSYGLNSTTTVLPEEGLSH